MKAVIQKVTKASVTVDSKVVSSILKGLMVLIGIGTDDTKEDADALCKKIVRMRLFADVNGEGLWKQSVKDISGEILSVSQFTLMAKTKKGTKPDFHLAQKSSLAQELYNYFLVTLRAEIGDEKVKDGVFGAMMDVGLINEGPVTILVDTKDP